METIRIREATLADAPRVLEIYADYVLHTAITFEYDVPALAEFENRMRRTMQAYPYLVIEESGTVQGYAYAGALKERAAYDWACEMTIYLDRAAQKHGLGRKLYEALEAALRQMGITNLYACIGYPQTEDAYLTKNSAGFHAHLGFVKIGAFHQCSYKFNRWYDMIWMEKIIAPHHAKQPPVVPYPALDKAQRPALRRF